MIQPVACGACAHVKSRTEFTWFHACPARHSELLLADLKGGRFKMYVAVEVSTL